VQELATSILGQRQFRAEFIETLHRHTEGNIFFLIESLRALAEEAGSLENVVNATLPASLITGGMTQVVQRRLDKMTTRYRPLLETAAVVGRELNLRLLRELNKGKRVDFEDWLTSASNAAIIEYRDEVWRFSHDKLRQQILVRLDSTRLKLLHRQVAEAIERLYPAEEQAAALVIHWREAGNAERELHYIRIAGEQATRYNAYDDARRLYERALMLTEEPLLVMEFNNLLGGVCEYLSQYDRAVQCLDIVLVLARKHNQQSALAEALHKLAWISMRQGDMVQAHRNAEEALGIARQIDHTLLTVRALSALGVIYVIQGDSAQSRAHLEQALPLVKTLDNDYLHATILNTLGAAYEGEGRIEEAINVLQQAAQMAEALRNRDLLANVHGNLGRILYIQKRSVLAEESFLKALPSFNEVGNLYGAALANDYLGLITAQRYDSAAAKPYLREGIRISRLIGAQTVTLLAVCGIAHLYIHEQNEARAAELIGMILGHPASAGDVDVQRESETVLGKLTLVADELQKALGHGHELNFDETMYHEQDALEMP
jgi:tetratricopeptide (TPR) repeat protein